MWSSQKPVQLAQVWSSAIGHGHFKTFSSAQQLLLIFRRLSRGFHGLARVGRWKVYQYLGGATAGRRPAPGRRPVSKRLSARLWSNHEVVPEDERVTNTNRKPRVWRGLETQIRDEKGMIYGHVRGEPDLPSSSHLSSFRDAMDQKDQCRYALVKLR